MMIHSEKIKLKEVHNGFSERDIHSKAILNQDRDAFLKYKIQRQRTSRIDENAADMTKFRTEVLELKSEVAEIKNLLLKLINKE